MTDKQDADRKPGLIRNEAAGFVEFVSEDVPTITGPMEARNVEPILRMAEPRELFGYRVYDRTPDPELAKVTAERDEALKLLDEGWEPRFHRMQFEGGEFDAELTGKSVEAIALAMVSHFKAIGAENYFELNIHDRAVPFQRYNVTLQKVGKLSPADKANAAIARAEAAESLLASRTTAIEAAIEALEPFAAFADLVAASRPGWSHDAFCIVSGRDISLTMEPFHRAGAVLAQLRSLIAGKETDVG